MDAEGLQHLGQQLSAILAGGMLVPLVMFLILALWGYRIGKPHSSLVAILGILISLGCAAYVTYQWWPLSAAERLTVGQQALSFHWATLGGLTDGIKINAGVKLDSLTVCVYLMVTIVSSCIFIFSRGYMAGHSDEVDHQSKYHRFFAYLSLFAFSLLGLVISANLLFIFIFWELVGVCSYLLIGFYFDRKYASDAAIKAFVVNRVGDFGFVIGLALMLVYLGDLSLEGAAASFGQLIVNPASAINATAFTMFGHPISIATIMGLCLFCGCIGKSAQLPLQVWLPDAMAGPTPVSALIHAATMVAAGVYLVARIFVLLTPDAQMGIAFIGCITLTMAAMIAMVQTDIKKALAYSTLSQLGYMVFGMGVGAWIGALFHLITHAFFKAMLFLGSGQVIEGCHHEQDIRKMGGLWRKMPWTAFTFLIGVLAIAGFGWPGKNTEPYNGLGGYYSKDEVLAVAYFRAYGGTGHAEESQSATQLSPQSSVLSPDSHTLPHGRVSDNSAIHNPQSAIASLPDGRVSEMETHQPVRLPKLPAWMLWCAIGIAYVTPFYMMRVWWLTFMGKPRDHHVHEHAHETPWMYVPLILLAIGTGLSSWFIFRPLIVDAASANAAWSASHAVAVTALDGHDEIVHHAAHAPLTNYVGYSFMVGFALAILIYIGGLKFAQRLIRLPVVSVIYNVLIHKFYFDEVYNAVWLGGTRAISRLCGAFDRWVIDYFIVENLARLTKMFAFFTGDRLDARGVDKMVEGVGQGAFRIGDVFRSLQTGRIRNYVLFAATSVTVVVIIAIMLTG